MKITCPHCQAKYQVNLPTLGHAGVDVKCARCQETFRVQKEAPTAVAAGTQGGGLDSDSGSSHTSAEPPAHKTSASTPDGGDQPLDQDLDSLLDDLIEKEISGKNAPPPPKQEVAPAADLDDLLDDLLNEPESPVAEGDPAESLKQGVEETTEEAPPMNEEALDAIWEEAIEEGEREEAEQGAPPAAQEAPEPTTEETETAEATGTAEAPAEEGSEEDLWAQAFADQAKVETEQAGTPPAETGEAAEGSDEESEEDLWAQAFADQAAVEAEQAGEVPAEATGSAEALAEEGSEEDLWAQAFADQAAVEAEQSGTPPAETGEAAEDSDEESEEDLWAKAFADQAAVESEQGGEAAEGSDEESEEDLWAKAFSEAEKEEGPADLDAVPMETGEDEDASGLDDIPEDELSELSSLKADDEGGLGLADEALAGYREEDYADDEDEGQYEFEAPRKKLGPIPLPTSKTGKLILGGSLLAVALVAGSAYFAMQTFAPAELIEEGKSASAPPATEPLPAADGGESQAPQEEPSPGESAEATPEDGAPQETKSTAVEKAQEALLGEPSDTEQRGSAAPASLGNALQPFATVVEMSTIMPVAYNATDIKVLSFTLQLEMDTPETAETMRESLPVYEKIMVTTVESFLKRKFYNDILYVKEKLVKRLELAINKGLKQGKVDKAKFKEFQIS